MAKHFVKDMIAIYIHEFVATCVAVGNDSYISRHSNQFCQKKKKKKKAVRK
jgi:predicted Zn-dependent protease